MILSSADQFRSWAADNGYKKGTALPTHVQFRLHSRVSATLPHDGVEDPKPPTKCYNSPVIKPPISTFPDHFSGLTHRPPTIVLSAFFNNTNEGKRLLQNNSDLCVPTVLDFVTSVAFHGPAIIPAMHDFFQGVDWERRRSKVWQDSVLSARTGYLKAFSIAWTVTKDKATAQASANAAFSSALKEEWDKRMQGICPFYPILGDAAPEGHS